MGHTAARTTRRYLATGAPQLSRLTERASALRRPRPAPPHARCDHRHPPRGPAQLQGLELHFDGLDPSTYIICKTAEEIEAAFAARLGEEEPDA